MDLAATQVSQATPASLHTPSADFTVLPWAAAASPDPVGSAGAGVTDTVGHILAAALLGRTLLRSRILRLGWPYAYAGWDYPWYYDDSNNDYAQDSGDSYAPPQDYQSQAEIDRLHNEVAQLRDQMQSRGVPRPPEPKEAAPEPTQLVFADKHTEQIENYAIVRQYLWVFDNSRARKIPLASLDIPATEKANQARGVDFAIPN